MPLNPKVQISEAGIHGHCWFAKEEFKKGEWIWKQREEGAPHTDLFLTYEQIHALPADKKEKWLALAYQVDDNLMCGFDPDKEPIYEELIENYVNHSCDGNAWYNGAELLVAMRDIAAGEEICYDYALTEHHPDFHFPQCLCKKANCRGEITGSDWKLPELQAKYGRHFLPHVLACIDKENERKAAEAKPESAATDE